MKYFWVLIFINGVNPTCLFGQPVIKVRGTYQPGEIRERAEFFAQTLDFDSTTFIRIMFSNHLPEDVDGYVLFEDKRKSFGISQVTIKINNRTHRSRQYMVLAHEMVHAWQLLTGTLKKVSTVHYQWKDQSHQHIGYIPYSNRKWETEAIADAWKLLDSYRASKTQASIH